jgi:hypothetical protein
MGWSEFLVTSPCPVVVPAALEGETRMDREASSSSSDAVTVVLVALGAERVNVLLPLRVSAS